MELVIEHLWKTYPNGVAALQDVSLTIPRGLFGLLGPNGAGKSTLMRILATLQEADAGSARLGGVDVLGDHEAVRRTLGYLPQEFGLYPRVSAEAMLDHFALLKGIADGRERRETVAALLQQTNLYAARRQKLGGFSGGMRQRFGIAVALIGSPRLIIVDEPTAGLDPAERARFLNLLSELGENAVVILSTHIVEDVSDLCTRMAIIEGGRILLEGEPARAVEAVRGRTWRRQVERAELPAFERALPVISTTLVGGRTVIHVHGDAPPDASFEPVEPDLKDVYFTVIRGIAIGGPSGPPPPDHPGDAQPIVRDAAVLPDGIAPSPPTTPFVTRSMDDEPVATPDAVPPPAFGSIPPPQPSSPTPPTEPASASPPSQPSSPSQPSQRTEPPALRPFATPSSGPGAAHVPVFGEASPHARVGEGRAGGSRENRDAVEAPRPGAPPWEDG
ncbi:ABC-type multidrug transport system, ATPase component [bacterium JGI 053]|nr:ABC-type multidrug transport system, ATPase component [bacterium JGI 053]